MLSEAELQKKWESLTFTDDFYLVLFSTIVHIDYYSVEH